jgi:hypothetical protein
VWRSPVAHLLWEQGAAGSNPATPTILTKQSRPPKKLLCRPCAVAQRLPPLHRPPRAEDAVQGGHGGPQVIRREVGITHRDLDIGVPE